MQYGLIFRCVISYHLIFQMELASKLADDGHLICGDNLVQVKHNEYVMSTSLVELSLFF